MADAGNDRMVNKIYGSFIDDAILREARASVALDGETQSEETVSIPLSYSQWDTIRDGLSSLASIKAMPYSRYRDVLFIYELIGDRLYGDVAQRESNALAKRR